MNIVELITNTMEYEVAQATNRYSGLYKVLQGKKTIRGIKEEYGLKNSRQGLSDELKLFCSKTPNWPKFVSILNTEQMLLGLHTYNVEYGWWAIPLSKFIKHNELFLGNTDEN